jgi:hypothetical protein
MLAVAGDTLDQVYLTTWAKNLGVEPGLQRVLNGI